jgi:hypothetical protein
MRPARFALSKIGSTITIGANILGLADRLSTSRIYEEKSEESSENG